MLYDHNTSLRCAGLPRSSIPMKARKIRQRSISIADEEEADDAASEALRKNVAARKQQKEKKGSKKPTLSFDDEEEAQVVLVKRPPSKIKPDLKGLKIASDVAKNSTQRSAPGEQELVKPGRPSGCTVCALTACCRTCRGLFSREAAGVTKKHCQAAFK